MSKLDNLIIPSEILSQIETQKTLKKGKMRIKAIDDESKEEETPDEYEGYSALAKSILNQLDGPQGSVHRLAFTVDPLKHNSYAGIYKERLRLIPPYVIKRIIVQDDLVAAIFQTRQNQASAFGRPRPTRFDTGFTIEPKQSALELIEKQDDEEIKLQQKEDLRNRIANATKVVLNCGYTDGWDHDERLTFPQYLSQVTRNILGMGMMATEVVWKDTNSGSKKFHGFRVIDAGTIYRATPYTQLTDSVRKDARRLLEEIKNEKLIPEKFMNEEYSWVQVINGRPIQAFTPNECMVHMPYAVPDIEMEGYPVTPIDTVISAITTHISITTYNKVYFQHGRAARGMLVIESDEADDRVLRNIKQQFNASINSAEKAWRMPVFSVGIGEKLSWQPIDNSARDMEFQYLTDMNARVILSAFMMSPEELPGWSYLSRGTNSQAISEANNEYKLEAARDVGIRPLLQSIEDFLNSSILPLIDENLAKMATIRLAGLDAETAERETIRLQQDMQVHLTMDEILEKVEKRAIGKEWGGEFLFNPNYQQILDKYFTVGEIKETFFDREGASKDPNWAYPRDAFWFQNQQLIQAQQQMQMQVEMQQQQATAMQQQGAPAAQGEAPQEGSSDQVATPDSQEQAPSDELNGAMDKASDAVQNG